MLFSLGLIAGTYAATRVWDFYRAQQQSRTLTQPAQQDSSPNSEIIAQNQTMVSAEEQASDHYVTLSTTALIMSTALMLLNHTTPLLKTINIIIISYASRPILRQTEHSLIKEKKLKNDFLNSLVVIGLVTTGAYFTAALITVLYHFGSKVLAKTQHRSEKMLTDIFAKQPTTAWLVKENTEVEISINDIRPDDIVVVNTGEVIPIDGVIVAGDAMIDQHALTGESVPAAKQRDEPVFAATLVLSGRIYIKVEKAGNDTVAAKINKTLNDMLDFKTDIQLTGEKWADKVAAPLLVLGSMALPFVGLSSTLAILYASPGNVFRFCGSLLTLNHLIIASRRGILIKEGGALERLVTVDTVIFDKTGTLTESQPQVGQIIQLHPAYSEDDVLSVALAAEYKMTHPIAKAIMSKAEQCGVHCPAIEYSEYKVGYGIKATFEDKVIWVGSLNFLKMQGIVVPAPLEAELVHTYQQHGHSLVMVAVNQDVVGALEIRFKVRPEVTALVQALRKRGIQHISIVSGDNIAPTQNLAESIGADSYFHNILPENKAQIVAKFQKQGKTVCFVGDGINDAIAMQQAEVSISLRGASAIATDMAQIILMDGSLAKLGDLFELSKDLDTRLRQSIYSGAMLASGYVIVFPLYLQAGFLPTLMSSLVVLVALIAHAMLPLKQLAKDESDRPKLIFDGNATHKQASV